MLQQLRQDIVLTVVPFAVSTGWSIYVCSEGKTGSISMHHQINVLSHLVLVQVKQRRAARLTCQRVKRLLGIDQSTVWNVVLQLHPVAVAVEVLKTKNSNYFHYYLFLLTVHILQHTHLYEYLLTPYHTPPLNLNLNFKKKLNPH